MKFLRLKVFGSINSFRQPDFHTYHKTLPLPPKTTVAGMLGAALGISPKEVNDNWLENNRFQMGIVGNANGKASDLWQIRKYESKQITAFKKFRADVENSNAKGDYEITTPYKTAVIVRELLYACEFTVYFSFNESSDYQLIKSHLLNPVWALSLGREDELIKIETIEELEIEEKENVYLQNTLLPINTNNEKYDIDLSKRNVGGNLLSEAPKIVKLPMTFSQKQGSEAREVKTFQDFTLVSHLPIKPKASKAFFDEELQIAFQIF
ncbi:MAG: CRISPR-associated protein Cas5 [Lewinellaceae bacterium]|nr:CRISPR-associated protein Cas5 [Lewinellaceae bacterium]